MSDDVPKDRLDLLFTACLRGGVYDSCGLGRGHEGHCKTYEWLADERAEKAEARVAELEAVLLTIAEYVDPHSTAADDFYAVRNIAEDALEKATGNATKSLELPDKATAQPAGKSPGSVAPDRKLDEQDRPGMPGTPESAEQPSSPAEAQKSRGAITAKQLYDHFRVTGQLAGTRPRVNSADTCEICCQVRAGRLTACLMHDFDDEEDDEPEGETDSKKHPLSCGYIAREDGDWKDCTCGIFTKEPVPTPLCVLCKKPSNPSTSYFCSEQCFESFQQTEPRSDPESCEYCGGTSHGKVSFELGRKKAFEDLLEWVTTQTGEG